MLLMQKKKWKEKPLKTVKVVNLRDHLLGRSTSGDTSPETSVPPVRTVGDGVVRGAHLETKGRTETRIYLADFLRTELTHLLGRPSCDAEENTFVRGPGHRTPRGGGAYKRSRAVQSSRYSRLSALTTPDVPTRGV